MVKTNTIETIDRLCSIVHAQNDIILEQALIIEQQLSVDEALKEDLAMKRIAAEKQLTDCENRMS